MFAPSDLNLLLGRVATAKGVPWAMDWAREGAAFGMSLAGPRGSGVELSLSSQGLHPDAPGARWLSPLRVQAPFALSAALLAKVYAQTPASVLQAYVDPLNLYLSRYEIHSIARMAAFLGQIGVESQNLQRIEENLTYTKADRLQAVFGSKAFGGEDAALFVKAPEALANRVYAGKGGNGDVASGDGWKYRGRGLIQVTLRGNYKAFADHCGVDVVASPDLLLKPTYAVWSSCWYWSAHKLNALADADDLATLTRRINAASHAHEQRMNLTRQARDVLRAAALGIE